MILESESKPGLLESELESESHDAGIGIKIGIVGCGKTLESESESDSTLLEWQSELESKGTGIINNLGDISMKIKQEEYVFCEIYCKHVLYYCSGTNQGNHMRNRSSDHYFL